MFGRSPFIDGTQREREILAEVLRLTRPGEFVMDFKGECVFRQRAYFYVLEPLTFVRLRRGLIVDNVAERLVKTADLRGPEPEAVGTRSRPPRS